MPKLILLACSQLISVDQLTNTLSLFSIIEQVNLSGFPSRMPQIFVTSLWQRDEQEKDLSYESSIQFVGPSGNIKGEWRAEWTFEKPRHRHILLATDIEFEAPGTHLFKIYIRKKGVLSFGEPVSLIEISAQQSAQFKDKGQS